MRVIALNDKSKGLLDSIVAETVGICDPCLIYLVSSKTGTDGTLKSLKLCVVTDTADNSAVERALLLGVNSDIPCDFIVYGKTEWDELTDDDCTFAYRVDNGGEKLYVKGQ